jgi:UPF0176 protein
MYICILRIMVSMKESFPYLTLLFYHYTPLEEAEVFAIRHLKFCKKLDLKGRIIVADEGLNGTVSGTREACEEYMLHLREDPRFQSMEFKIDEVEKISFTKIFCRYKAEIVHSGLRGNKQINPWEKTGIHLEPEKFLEMKNEEDVLVLDVRSNYEHRLGKFSGAMTLDLNHFRDFPEKINELSGYKNKKIITYCTGGVKCEKASAFLIDQGFKEVYQLKGGIIHYSKKTGGKDFEGRCYVFDDRVSVPVNYINPVIIGKCRDCGSPTEKMINCANPLCNDHFLQCEACGIKTQGCCSIECFEHPSRRVYDGSGSY